MHDFAMSHMNRWLFLFVQWFKRDLAGRYRGSWLGLLWPLVQPAAQIAVFTMVLHGFMQVRWPSVEVGQAEGPGSAWSYALNVLAGLAVFNFFAEVLGRAPAAILSQPNLVTKVKFPLLLLPAVTVGVALVHVGMGAAVLVLASAASGTLSQQVAWLPLWLLPVVLYGTALAFVLASLGVYVRDIGQATPAITSLLMFLTPIFYPMAAIPANLRSWFELNPVGWAAESLRGLLLEARALDLAAWGWHLTVSVVAAVVAVWLFRQLEEGFADVL
jgi:lipopolysaccharide transport system permease protein